MSPFLTAEWHNLLNVTFRVNPDLLLPHVPKGVELDVQDGFAYVSLVAFEFLNTRVKGLKIPFHVHFPEINLRYYLKYKERRGVAFIKEFVPKYCIAKVANVIYNEPYQSIPMEMESHFEGNELHGKHTFYVDNELQTISFRAKNELSVPAEDSLTHYFKEHEIGFGIGHDGNTLYYKVHHPKWRVYDLISYHYQLDFGKVYGENWAFLANETPYCVCLAEGSAVEVYPAQKTLF